MLELRGVQQVFKNGKAAFSPLDLHVSRGEIVGILGTSGCGKSSLLRVISGLAAPTAGSMKLDEAPLSGLDERINLVFQEPRLLPWKTVYQNVLFGQGKDKNPALVRTMLEKVGLSKFADHYPKECSGGMAQRVALARALVRTPEVLLLDEPFSALDAFIRMQLQDLVLELHRSYKPTIVLVTHDLDEALYLCDRIIVLRGQPGKLVKNMIIRKDKPRYRGDPSLALLKEDILEVLDLSTHFEPDLEYAI